MEKSSKKKLTREITQFLQDQIDNSDSSEVKQVWGHIDFTPIYLFQTEDSLRLRLAGHQLLKLYFDHETFEKDKDFTGGELLTLSKRMNAPFYVHKRKITVYSDEIIVMLKLAGDVTSWLKLFN